MRFLKQCLQALTSYPLSLPDPARRPPAFSIVHTDREPGTGYGHTHLYPTLSKHTHLAEAHCLSPTHSRNTDEKAGTVLTLRKLLYQLYRTGSRTSYELIGYRSCGITFFA